MGKRDGSERSAGVDIAASPRLDVLPLHSTDLLTLLDESGIIRYESPSIERLYGFDQDELVGEQVAEYFHPEDRETVLDAFQRIVESETQRVESVEYRHRMADGSYRWIESVGSTDPTPEGNYVINSRDISERKRRERQLERTRQRVRSERDGKEAIRSLLMQTSTGTEIAANTCRLLVDTYGYQMAWVLRQYDSEAVTDTVLTASHGDDRGLLARSDSTDGPDEATRRTLETGEPTAIAADEEGEFADRLSACGLTAVRSVPVAHDGILYGALTVAREESDREFSRELVAEFAGAIGFKHQLHRQQRTLRGETVTELSLQITGGHFLTVLSSASELPDGTELVAHELQADADGTVTYLLQTTDVSAETLADAGSPVETVHAVTPAGGDEGSLVRVRVDTPTVGSVLSQYGCAVQSIRARDGRLDVTVGCPRLTSIEDVAEAVRTQWPETTIRSRQERPVDDQTATFEGLTDKQEQALRAATVAGFFDRPQGATASDVAEVLDVSRSTFLHHLRTAEQKVFGDAFEGAAEE